MEFGGDIKIICPSLGFLKIDNRRLKFIKYLCIVTHF